MKPNSNAYCSAKRYMTNMLRCLRQDTKMINNDWICRLKDCPAIDQGRGLIDRAGFMTSLASRFESSLERIQLRRLILRNVEYEMHIE